MSDAITTKLWLARPNTYEIDPLVRPLVHLPAPVDYSLTIVGEYGLQHIAARWRRSPRRWVRVVGWSAPIAQTAVNAMCAVHNARLLNR